jgi:RNA polymerase sigma-70 factor (ECF subfamily)
MSACVRRQADKLPNHYRTVIWLFDQQGFSLQETADILGITLANTKVRLHRARRQLKSILQENCRFNRDERDVLVCIPRISTRRAMSGCQIAPAPNQKRHPA